MMAKKKIGRPSKKDREIDMSDDNDIEENYENAGDMSCSVCNAHYHITEGYSDEYCSKDCYDSAMSENGDY